MRMCVCANDEPLLFFIRRLKINHKPLGSYEIILEDGTAANNIGFKTRVAISIFEVPIIT